MLVDHLVRALDVELVAVGPQLGEQLDQLAPLLLGEADAPVHLGVEVARRVRWRACGLEP